MEMQSLTLSPAYGMAVRHPVGTAKDVAKGVTQIVKDPVGVLKAIVQQVAADFTSGDPRKAGELIGKVLIAAVGTEVSAEKMAALLSKIRALSAGKTVAFTAEQTGILEKALASEKSLARNDQIPSIGGRIPINSKYAGGTHPSGVKFTPQGFPDFGPHAVAEVKLEGLTGNLAKDSAKANAAAGFDSTPEGYVWHHVEDGKTMQLIPRELHNSVRHTGGTAVIRNGGFDSK